MTLLPSVDLLFAASRGLAAVWAAVAPTSAPQILLIGSANSLEPLAD